MNFRLLLLTMLIDSLLFVVCRTRLITRYSLRPSSAISRVFNCYSARKGGIMLLATRYWVLATGYWLLVTGPLAHINCNSLNATYTFSFLQLVNRRHPCTRPFLLHRRRHFPPGSCSHLWALLLIARKRQKGERKRTRERELRDMCRAE